MNNNQTFSLPSSKVVDCRRSLGRRPEADGLLGQGRSGDTDGLERRRGRPTPKVASSTTTGATGAVTDTALSVDGALVNRIGLVVW